MIARGIMLVASLPPYPSPPPFLFLAPFFYLTADLSLTHLYFSRFSEILDGQKRRNTSLCVPHHMRNTAERYYIHIHRLYIYICKKKIYG